MEKSWKRFLSMLVVVVMVLSMLPASVFAAETTITDEAGLTAAIANGGTYTLGTDITVNAAITSSATTTIDLAGHDINRAGALFTVNAGTLTIKDTVGGGELKGNGSTNGTAVTINSTGHFILESGTITNFKYATCPAIRLDSANARFTMNGGSITGNTASSSGYGAVYAYRGTFTMTGGSIENNTNGTSAGRDVYFGHGTQKSEMYISGDARIGYLNIPNDTAVTVISITNLTEGASIGPVSKALSTLAKATVTTDDTVDVDGTTYVYKENVVIEDPEAMVGETPYATLADAIANANGAEIDLQKTVTLAATTISSSVKIDLNGNNINAAGALFSVKAGGNLTILDSVGGGALMGDGTTSGNAVTVEGGGKFVLDGGAITKFKGYAVRVETSSNFEMNGGSISGITATGAVFNSRGTFTMTGGSIANATTYALYIGHGSVQAKNYISGTAQIGKVGYYSTAANPIVSITELEEGASIGPVATGTTIATDDTVAENGGVYTYNAPHVHNYVGEVTKEATCKEDGVMTYACECGEGTYTEVIPATGEHVYVKTVTKPATCKEDGEATWSCGCGDSYNETIPATGVHDYNENGYCSCGEPNPDAVAQVGDKLYLNLADAITAANVNGTTATVTVLQNTTLTKGYLIDRGVDLTIDLNGCKVTVTGENLNSGYVFQLRASGTEGVAKLTINDTKGGGEFNAEGATGIKAFVRINNDGIFTLAGGKITKVTGSENGSVVKVNSAGAQFIMTEGEISGNTSTSGAIVCVPQGVFTMSGGRILDNETNVENDCYDVKCYSAGDVVISGTAYVDAIWSTATDVTLGELTEDAKIVSREALTYGTNYKISRDEDGLYVYEVGTHTHDYTYETVITESTCTVAGTKADKCLCGKAKVVDLEKAPHTPVEGSHDCGVCQNVISDCIDENERDHKCDICTAPMGGDHVAAEGSHNCDYCGKPADDGCVDSDTDQDHICDICGEPVGGHTYGDWIVVTPADCGNDGLKKKVCDCGDEITEVIPATGDHVYATEVEGSRVPSTCRTNGSVIMQCGCGATQKQILGLDPNNHEKLVVTPGWAPTCTEWGAEDGEMCEACEVVTHEQQGIQPLTHAYGDWETVTEPKCEEDGLEKQVCGRCGDEKTQVIPATGHDYTAVVTPPTCTEDGYTTHTCGNCDDSYTDNVVPATGHTYGEWVVETPADCENNGLKKKTCACGDVVEEVIPMTGHDYDDDGYCTCGEPNPDAVAEVDDKLYLSLQAAIDAANGGTVILRTDIELTEAVTVAYGNTVTLDLSGKVISGVSSAAKSSAVIINDGTLTIKDSGTGGKITALAQNPDTSSVPAYANNTITNYGTLNIEGGTIENSTSDDARACYPIDNNSTKRNVVLNITGGTVTGRGAIRQFANSATFTNTVNISGGTVTGRSYAIWVQNPSDNNLGVYNTADYKADLNISGGSVGKLLLEPSAEFDAAITGGTIKEIAYWQPDEVETSRNLAGFVSGGTFSSAVAEEFCAEGFIPTDDGNGNYGVKEGTYVAEVGGKKYETLQAAVDAAEPGDTITLLGDATGAGVVINKNITIDFGGYTYTVVGKKADGLVGSAGTETLGFQIHKNYDVTLKRGTLATDTDECKMLVQNYANLTLENITLDGTGSANMKYVLSNNSGNVALNGETNITAPAGAVAFDVCEYGSYVIPNVTVNTTGTITGKIEVAGGNLDVDAGTFVSDGDIFYVTSGNLTIDGGDFTAVDNVVYIRGGDVTINDGTLKSTGGDYAAIQGNGYYAGNVTVNGGTIESADVGIYWPQNGALTITGGTITGKTAVYAKSGTITIEGGKLIATGDKVDYNYNGNAGDATGDALVIDSCGGNYETPAVSVTGGTFESDNASAVASYANGNETVITGFITDGTFKGDVENELCADGLHIADNGDGTSGTEEHVYGEWETVTEADCENDGLKKQVCSCGDEITEVIPATGHNYSPVVTDPTCTEDGYTTHTCGNCGDSYITDETPALGHTYGEWEIVDEADCENDGLQKKTCHCGDEITEVIPATGHNYSSAVTAPTCTAQGYTTHTCGNCGDEYVDSYTDMIDHAWDEGVVTLEPTTTTEGIMTYTCGTCGEKKTEPIPVIEVSASIDFTGAALMFKDEIKIKFYFDVKGISGDFLSNAGIEISTDGTFDSSNVTVYTGMNKNGVEYEIVTAGIPAKNMGDLLYVRAFVEVNGEKVYSPRSISYSPVVYSQYHIEEAAKDPTNQKKMDMAKLCIALMNYGAEAQEYFAGKGQYTYTTLMNSFITAEQQAWLDTAADVTPTKDVPAYAWTPAEASKIQLTGISGVFKGALQMKLYAKAAGPVKMYYWTEATAGDELLIENAAEMSDVGLNGDEYEGYITGISAKNSGDTLYICAAVELDGVTYYTKVVAYSMHKYAGIEIEGGTAMAELSEALVIYSNVAKNYMATYNPQE